MSEAAEEFTYDPGSSQNASFSETDLQSAALKVFSKTMSLFDAASTYQIPMLKLWERVLNTVKVEDNAGILTKSEEKEIARMIREATDIGCQPTMDDFIYTVKTTLASKGQLSKLENNKLGNEWILGFLNRHKGITLKPSQSSKKQSGSSHGSSELLNRLIKKESPQDCAINNLSPHEALHRAIEEVQQKGVDVFTAARLYHVSTISLWDEISGKDTSNTPKPSSTKLGADEEEEIADLLRDAISKGLEITKEDLRETVKAILDSKGRVTKFADNKPSSSWVPLFLMRNPGITIKQKSSRPSSGERIENTGQVFRKDIVVASQECTAANSHSRDDDLSSQSNPFKKSTIVSSGTSVKTSEMSKVCTSSTVNKDPTVQSSSLSATSTISTSSPTISSTSYQYSGVSSSSVSSACLMTTTAYSTECNTVPSSFISDSNALTSSVRIPMPVDSLDSNSFPSFVRNPLTVDNFSIPIPATTITRVAQESRMTAATPDSSFSLLKRLTMINFSLGEERVMHYLYCMEHGQDLHDLDYCYWKNLVTRIVPPPPFTKSSLHSQAFPCNPKTNACPRPNSTSRFESFTSSLTSFPYEPHPASHNNHYQMHHKKSTYFKKNYRNQKNNENKCPKPVNKQNKTDSEEQKKAEKKGNKKVEEIKELTQKGKRKDESHDVAIVEPEPKKRKKMNDSDGEEEQEVLEKLVQIKRPKKDKSSKNKHSNAKKENKDEDAEEGEMVKIRKKKKKAKKDKKAKQEEAEVEEEEERTSKKKKKKIKRTECANPVIRVEVGMKRQNRRVVFNDSSSDN